MSSNVKLNLPAFTAFRQSAMAPVNAEAQRMAARANGMGVANHAGQPEYEAVPAIASGKGAVALVSTGNKAARVDNALHNTLAKAVGGGG